MIRINSVVSLRGLRLGSAVFAAVLATVLVGACSSSGSADTGGGGASVSHGPAPTGKPVTIGVIYTEGTGVGNTVEIAGGAQAAAKYINTELGGIAGHPVQIDACNGRATPENNTTCATKFVNEGAVDVIGLEGLWGQNGQPIAAKAGLLNQTSPIAASEFTGATSYPFDGGGVAGPGALVEMAVSKGWKHVACVYINIASVQQQCELNFAKPLQAHGVSVKLIPVDPTATDFSQYAAAAQGAQPDGVLLLQTASSNARFVQAAQQLGLKTTYLSGLTSVGQKQFFDVVGSAADGTIVYAPLRLWTDKTNPDVQKFLAAMAKYASSVQVDGQSELAFAAVMNIKKLGDQLGADHLGRSDYLHAVQTLANFQCFAGPTLSAAQHLPGLPHAYETGAFLYSVTSGKWTLQGNGITTIK